MCKHKVTGSVESQTAVERRKHPVYWFEDGSLILEVHNVEFRVHRSLFQRHSSFLASAKPRTTCAATLAADDAHNVAHSVYCSIDQGFNSRDTEALLEHMYHDFPLSPDSSFERIVAVLRSTGPQQFDMPTPHAHAKAILVSYFDRKNPSNIGPDILSEAVAIARVFRISPVLKTALYHTMIIADLDHDDADVTVLDPQIQLPGSTTVSESPFTTNTGKGYKLSKLDVNLCKSLMTRVIDHFTPILFTPATTPHMACTDVFADTWMPLIISPALESDGVYKPIETLEQMRSIDWGKHGLCPVCVEEKREEWRKEQETVWNMIEKWLEEEAEVGSWHIQWLKH
ncbi:hypothetical protein D9756_001166 [Leucocoprinus leucothites]|uniref:BTB domain-containing protein n=1 Tax=Leucocoprinus leucothites TaxID=201217 RepID=A0A8H5LHZ7_9AGAR|nr:hypothetical protein D9756_001166 [Leucoagaricus leucothites]